jgi:hypothetical protein
VRVPPLRHQLALAVPDVGQTSESIVLQFEKGIWIVERLADEGKLGSIHSEDACKYGAARKRRDERRKGERGPLAL